MLYYNSNIIYKLYTALYAKGNITYKSTVEKLHIWGSPAWILENLMFCKCLGESSIFC